MSTPKIRIRGLSKAFGSKVVLDGIDLDVETGTSMVIIGGSGSGKSVLLRCILGLINPMPVPSKLMGKTFSPHLAQDRKNCAARLVCSSRMQPCSTA